MPVDKIKAQFRGNVSEEDLEDVFESVEIQGEYEWLDELHNEHLHGDYKRVDEGGFNVYQIEDDNASASFTKEENVQNAQEDYEQKLSNLYISGENTMNMASKFENELGGDVEILLRRYTFDIDEPLFSDLNPNKNSSSGFNVPGGDTFQYFSFTYGSPSIKVITDSGIDEIKAQETITKIAEAIKNTNWPKIKEYKNSIIGDVNMENLNEKFNVKEEVSDREMSKNNSAVYVEFDDGDLVGIRRELIVGISEISLEKAREKVQKLKDAGVVKLKEDIDKSTKIQRVDYKNTTPLEELVDCEL